MGMIYRIAAANSSAADQQLADVVCTGVHDERVINAQIEKLSRGGTIQLLDGDYYIDGFEQEGNTAIFFGYNNGEARTIRFIGDTDSKSYNTQFGAVLHVTKAALDSLPEGQTGRVFCGTEKKPDAPGVFYRYTFVNDTVFENFFLFLYDASRPVIGIDCSRFGLAAIQYVCIYTERHLQERFLHLKATTPARGCIGVRSFGMASDGTGRMGFTNVAVGGLHTGFDLIGADNLIMRNCQAARCCCGFVFGQSAKTLTMINCSDEGNTHLPVFRGTGQLTAIDLTIERFDPAYIPDDPDGDPERFAVEEIPGGWHGFLSYNMEGNALGQNHFWKQGHGINFYTFNLQHGRNSRPEYPEYLETYFDRETNRMLLWTGEQWVDAMGNPAAP